MKNQIHPTAIVDDGAQIGEIHLYGIGHVCGARPLVKEWPRAECVCRQ